MASAKVLEVRGFTTGTRLGIHFLAIAIEDLVTVATAHDHRSSFPVEFAKGKLFVTARITAASAPRSIAIAESERLPRPCRESLGRHRNNSDLRYM